MACTPTWIARRSAMDRPLVGVAGRIPSGRVRPGDAGGASFPTSVVRLHDLSDEAGAREVPVAGAPRPAARCGRSPASNRRGRHRPRLGNRGWGHLRRPRRRSRAVAEVGWRCRPTPHGPSGRADGRSAAPALTPVALQRHHRRLTGYSNSTEMLIGRAIRRMASSNRPATETTLTLGTLGRAGLDAVGS